MLIKCINMSRFSEFSLYNRTDELLRPAEKRLSSQFHSTDNIQLVYKRAQSEIDSHIPYSDVMTAMDAVFRLAIRTENRPGVVEMNTDVLRRLSDATERTNTSQHRFAERVFKNSNVPAQFLPTPSFSFHNDD
ncbi:unnamed protein product, partial [Hapterophycus canaliculatus]